MASKNSSLGKASKAKKDEFYTQLTDIENELRHYKAYFKGKVVFCNCDDPYESNFVKYFAMNFNALGVKKLIATCYATSPIIYSQLTFFGEPEPIGSISNEKKPYKIEITEVRDENGDGAINLDDFEIMLRNNPPKLLNGDGDFRSEECIKLLKEADVVVTNPPFSLFREYVAQLIEYEKKFIIIGNQNAITYKEIFTLLRDNKVWLGYKFGDMAFTVPDSYEPRETRFWIDENGQKWRSMGNICWYSVITWVQTIFPKYRKEMKGLEWGLLFNQYGNDSLDPAVLETKITALMADKEVTKKSGVYEYLLSGKEKFLSLRQFDDDDKRSAYEQQQGICPICSKHLDFDKMHADHITPWHAGGKTVPENLQMLCRDCNLKKSGQE